LDKKTLPIIIALGLVILFYWPILEFLGLVEAPEKTTEIVVPDTVVQQQFTPVGVAPQAESKPVTAETATPVALSETDTTAIDTVIVETAEYRVLLSSKGGGPVSLLLKDYTYRDGEPIEMIPDPVAPIPDARFAGGTFSTSQLHYTCNLQPGTYDAKREPLEVIYSYAGADGGLIERKFTFHPDKHHFDMQFNIPEPAKFGFERSYDLWWGNPLGLTEPDAEADYKLMEAVAMMGGSREKLDDFKDDNLNQKLDGEVSWVGLRSKYFAAIVIPSDRNGESVLAQGFKGNPTGEIEQRSITVGMEMPFAAMNPISDRFEVFVGPLDYLMMADYDVGLEDMLDIGTMPVLGLLIKPFAIGVIWLLPKMYSAIPNYGIVIILFALLVKIVTLPLSLKSFKSMHAMKELQPKIEELKKKHKKDAQKLNQETMKMYKAHGVNPISGCLPMLPQMPLIFALFSVFRSTILLRDAPFFWFINDLSRGAQSFTDPYIILVLIMVGAQFVSQKFTMASTQQNKMLMYMMPLIMGFFFYQFAAGLILYWTMFSILSLLDYFVFRRKREPQVKTA